MSPRRPPSEINDAISRVLTLGVVISSAVLAAGVVLMALASPAGTPASLQAMLDAGFGRPTLDPGALAAGILSGNPVSLLELGTLILFVTPMARVAASVLLFLRERDILYAGITVLVLAMLLVAVFVIGPIEALPLPG